MLQLVEHKTERARSGRVGQLPLPIGTTVWLIQHMDTQRFYSYCYLDQDDATKVMQRLHDDWSPRTIVTNFVTGRERPIHVHKMDWSGIDPRATPHTKG